jgi:hypothetical protein
LGGLDMADVTVSQEEFKELCKDQARLQILIAFVESENIVTAEDIRKILGIKKESEEE